MVVETKYALTKRVLRNGSVNLEIRTENSEHGEFTKYTISVGPEGNQHNTRLDLSQENFDHLLECINGL